MHMLELLHASDSPTLVLESCEREPILTDILNCFALH